MFSFNSYIPPDPPTVHFERAETVVGEFPADQFNRSANSTVNQFDTSFGLASSPPPPFNGMALNDSRNYISDASLNFYPPPPSNYNNSHPDIFDPPTVQKPKLDERETFSAKGDFKKKNREKTHFGSYFCVSKISRYFFHQTEIEDSWGSTIFNLEKLSPGISAGLQKGDWLELARRVQSHRYLGGFRSILSFPASLSHHRRVIM